MGLLLVESKEVTVKLLSADFSHSGIFVSSGGVERLIGTTGRHSSHAVRLHMTSVVVVKGCKPVAETATVYRPFCSISAVAEPSELV